MKRLIGYVIRSRIVSYKPPKVYHTRGIAERYGKGGEIVEAFVEIE